MDIPVADEGMSAPASQQSFPAEDIQKHFIAWNILSRALEGSRDRDTLRHTSSPAAAWRALVDTHKARVRCLLSIISRRVKPGANTIPVFGAMIEDVRKLRANVSDNEDEVV